MGAKARRRATTPARASTQSPSGRHVPTQGLYGWITHTDLGSHDPTATKAWCVEVLGWTFGPSFPMPDGEYHLFAYSDKGGGGIHRVGPGEAPGSVPFVHVADTALVFEKALRAGAEQVTAPTRVMEGVTLAVVRAPGGITIGLSGP